MDIPIAELLKIVTDFTWKNFFAGLVVITLAVFIFSLFERYTSSFRLTRLQRSAELIAKLQQIDLTITNSSQELQSDYKALVIQANEAISAKPLSFDILPTKLHLSLDAFWKFLAGYAAWFVFGIIALTNMKKGDKWDTFKGILLVGFISGIVGIWIPAIWWPWFHLFIYPIMFLVAFFLLILPFGYIASKRSANQKV